jgi:type I site-specific restriction endonuclease
MDPVQVLSALASLALVLGIGIGLLQLRGLAKQRQEDMVLRVYAPFFDPAFSRAYWQVQTWKFTTFEQWDAEATLDEKAALNVVRMLFETMGLLYKRGFAKIDFMDDLLSSSTLITWNKIAPIIYGYRAKANAPDWSRWHEALARALDKRLTELGRPHPAIEQPADSPPGRAAE